MLGGAMAPASPLAPPLKSARAHYGERGGRGPEHGERQREQCGAEAATERGLLESDESTLCLAE